MVPRIVSTCAPPFTASDGGQMLVMVGVWLFTVTLTVMFWDLLVTLVPEATTVMLAV